ncbi:MAG TPA: Wzz/FepE/Etk N-terminal domain-containing protein, partial [Aestuariivirga sp.]|nr:Wzz/FepE/Etk N-terminal domain-containing protein [Aestuariivirga sp.]
AMNYQPEFASTINLLDVVRGMGRRKLVILVFTLVALCAGLMIVKFLKPTYSTEAQILIENLASPFDRTQSPDPQQPDPVDDRVIKSQMSVLKSQDVALRVVTSLNLQDRPEFDSLKQKGVGKIKQLLLNFGFGVDPRLQTPQQRALDRLTGGLAVYQFPDSNVVAVKYSSTDPRTAAEVANALVTIYVASTAETNSQPTTRARDWIAGQIEDLRRKVAASDASIEEFRSQAGLLQGENSTLGTQELSELNTQITLAEAARTEAEERAKSIKNVLATKGTVVGSTDVLNSTIVQSLREQQVASARRVAELSATYLPSHPKMIAAQNDLRNIDRQIRGEALKLVDSLDQQARIAEAREKSLRARLEEMKGRESTANLASVKLKALERESAADKALLESLLLRYADASARQDLSTQPGMARIIQHAAIPTSPSFPKPGPLVLLITLAGLAFSLGLSFLMEIMAAANRLGLPAANNAPQPSEPQKPAAFAESSAPQIQEAPPLRHFPEAPSLAANSIQAFAALPSATSPEGNLELLRDVDNQDRHGLHAASRQVADWALKLQRMAALRRLAITGMGGGAGDSSMATVAIARAIAAKGARVVVIDLATEGSSIDMLFGLPAGPGFVDLLAGSTDFTKVIARDPLSNAHLLRFGTERNEATLSLMDQRTEAVLNALGNIYDVVIIHAGETSGRTTLLLIKCQAALLLAPRLRQGDVAKTAKSLLVSGLAEVQFVRLEPATTGNDRIAASA